MFRGLHQSHLGLFHGGRCGEAPMEAVCPFMGCDLVYPCRHCSHWLCTGQNPVWKRWNVSRCKPMSWPQTFQISADPTTYGPMALRDEVVTYTAVLQAHLQRPTTLQGEIWMKHSRILLSKSEGEEGEYEKYDGCKKHFKFRSLNNIHQWAIYFGWIQDDLNTI